MFFNRPVVIMADKSKLDMVREGMGLRGERL